MRNKTITHRYAGRKGVEGKRDLRGVEYDVLVVDAEGLELVGALLRHVAIVARRDGRGDEGPLTQWVASD